MKWYVATKNITRMGPFKTQIEASKHIMVHDHNCSFDKFLYKGSEKCVCTLRPAEGAFVWPEEK